MRVITARNVNDALPLGLHLLREEGKEYETRNGPALVFPDPVTTVYTKPTERVLFHPLRDCNPFFHLYEGLWMLAGRNDVAGVARFAKNMKSYSDDGSTLNGAYGYRWRHHFHGDQLVALIFQLRKDPSTRRAILAMWDGGADGRGNSKDYPCNLAVHFQAYSGVLDMTVFNRSNDIIWGAYGANAVHMSMLQEFVAGAVGLPVGRYWQVSDNFHAYKSLYDKLESIADSAPDFYREYAHHNFYVSDAIKTFPMVNSDWSHWLRDLAVTINEGSNFAARDPFFTKIVVPMINAHDAYKDKKRYGADRFNVAHEILDQMPKNVDWQVNAIDWISRRKAEAQRAEDDGVNYEGG